MLGLIECPPITKFHLYLGPKEEHIPLTYERQDSDHILHLCMNRINKWHPYHKWNKRNVKNYEPRIETQRLVFQHQDHDMKPVLTKMIRCTEKYALIKADGDRSHYLLKNYDKRTEKEYWGIESEDLFTIFMKFSLKPSNKNELFENGQIDDDDDTQSKTLGTVGRSHTF